VRPVCGFGEFYGRIFGSPKMLLGQYSSKLVISLTGCTFSHPHTNVFIVVFLHFSVELQPKSGLGPLNTHTHTHGRAPLNEWSVHRRGCYLRKKQQIQEMDFQKFSDIRTSDPINKRLQT